METTKLIRRKDIEADVLDDRWEIYKLYQVDNCLFVNDIGHGVLKPLFSFRICFKPDKTEEYIREKYNLECILDNKKIDEDDDNFAKHDTGNLYQNRCPKCGSDLFRLYLFGTENVKCAQCGEIISVGN